MPHVLPVLRKLEEDFDPPLGETPPNVMAELGHTDAAFTLGVYAQVMRRDEEEKAKLAALVEGVWANGWANEAAKAPEAQETWAL
jgi:hypothetical protein